MYPHVDVQIEGTSKNVIYTIEAVLSLLQGEMSFKRIDRSESADKETVLIV